METGCEQPARWRTRSRSNKIFDWQLDRELLESDLWVLSAHRYWRGDVGLRTIIPPNLARLRFPPSPSPRAEFSILERLNRIPKKKIGQGRFPMNGILAHSCYQLQAKMDTSSPAVFVNAELLNLYIGRRVRALVQVMRSEGGAIIGQSTDGHQLVIRGSQPFSQPRFIEVIGIAESNQSIRAEICTDFGETCDTSSYNRLCQLANGEFKSLFL
ncbi:hypothetical protein ACLOJK_026399 [Asimina triloba]